MTLALALLTVPGLCDCVQTLKTDVNPVGFKPDGMLLPYGLFFNLL
ncbi:MAG: hypothetical protein LBE04_01195 [Prevotellaceae bacterium]|nr:hypothetical protein [Prevotellaceae bacterium]